MSSSRHPQSDGQSERVIQTCKQYLRIFCNYYQTNWDELLWLAEFAYNSAIQETLGGLSPFQVVYNCQPFTPLTLIHYQQRQAGIPEVDEYLSTISLASQRCTSELEKLGLTSDNVFLNIPSDLDKHVSKNLKIAKDQFIKYANQKRQLVKIKVGDQVLISTKDLEYSQYAAEGVKTLGPKYIGPYTILKEITPTSFRLRLPGHLTLVPTFHTSQLTKYHAPDTLSPCTTGFVRKWEKIPIDKISNRKIQQGTTFYKVHWDNGESQWVPARHLSQAHRLIMAWEDSI